jgi:hypothetical protein
MAASRIDSASQTVENGERRRVRRVAQLLRRHKEGRVRRVGKIGRRAESVSQYWLFFLLFNNQNNIRYRLISPPPSKGYSRCSLHLAHPSTRPQSAGRGVLVVGVSRDGKVEETSEFGQKPTPPPLIDQSESFSIVGAAAHFLSNNLPSLTWLRRSRSQNFRKSQRFDFVCFLSCGRRIFVVSEEWIFLQGK